MAGPGRTEPGGQEGHATGGIQDYIKEVGETPHKPEHGIRPSARAVHRLPAITSRGTGDMGSDVERLGPALTAQKHQVLVKQIRRGHGVPSCSISHALPSIHDIPEGGLQ